MPPVSFKAVRSFSSEDPNYPAANLLKPGNRKWKCREAGERQAFVVLRLAEPVQISGIDIGNEHSAHIEVMVARSGPANPSFTEIMLTCKFMNPVDSRNSTAPNRVQCFTAAALIPSVANEKWDLVKIICTQPFNSRVKYGLAFVAVHTSTGEKKDKSLVPERFQQKIDAEASSTRATLGLNLGRFKLREESPDSDEAAGHSNVFARWRDKNQTGPKTPAPSVSALMRDSSTVKALQKAIPSPGSVRNVAVQRPKPQFFADSDDEPRDAEKSSSKVKTNRNDVSVLYDAEDEVPGRGRNDNPVSRSVNTGTTPKADLPHGKKPAKLHDVSSSKFKEFLDLTGESSIRTPQRNVGRDSLNPTQKATSSSSNQINRQSKKTPEKSLNSVKSPLPIVVEAVPSSKRLSSPTRTAGPKLDTPSKKPKVAIVDVASDKEEKKTIRYKPFGRLLENVVLVISGIQNPDRATIRNQALAMGAKYKPDWDASCTHLICAYKNTPKYNQVRGKGKIIKKDWIEKCFTTRKRLSWRKFALDTDEANVTDSEDEIVDEESRPVERGPVAEAAEETNPETTMMICELSDSDGGAAPNPYDVSTEDEFGRREENSEQNLGFFEGNVFFLHPELSAVDVIKLTKCIETYKGTVSKEMTGVDYVIARTKQTLPANSRAEVVKPLWVYECNDMECIIPIHRYRI